MGRFPKPIENIGTRANIHNDTKADNHNGTKANIRKGMKADIHNRTIHIPWAVAGRAGGEENIENGTGRGDGGTTSPSALFLFGLLLLSFPRLAGLLLPHSSPSSSSLSFSLSLLLLFLLPPLSLFPPSSSSSFFVLPPPSTYLLFFPPGRRRRAASDLTTAPGQVLLGCGSQGPSTGSHRQGAQCRGCVAALAVGVRQ